MLTSGWHSGAIFGPSASSAAVSKLLKLPANLIEDAVGIACTQACGLMSAQFEGEVKRAHHGCDGLRRGLPPSNAKKVQETQDLPSIKTETSELFYHRGGWKA